MTLWSHDCIIFNYPARQHAKNKINNFGKWCSIMKKINMSIHYCVTWQTQFCGNKLCNYNGLINELTVKYHDRMFPFCSNYPSMQVASTWRHTTSKIVIGFRGALWLWSIFALNLVKGETVVNARSSSCSVGYFCRTLKRTWIWPKNLSKNPSSGTPSSSMLKRTNGLKGRQTERMKLIVAFRTSFANAHKKVEENTRWVKWCGCISLSLCLENSTEIPLPSEVI
jgi:hypothetical protein